MNSFCHSAACYQDLNDMNAVLLLNPDVFLLIVHILDISVPLPPKCCDHC